jgi:hypothetical protein
MHMLGLYQFAAHVMVYDLAQSLLQCPQHGGGRCVPSRNQRRRGKLLRFSGLSSCVTVA